MHRIHITRQFFLASYTFSKKTKIIYSLGECVYQITGLYGFSFAQEVAYKHTNTPTQQYEG